MGKEAAKLAPPAIMKLVQNVKGNIKASLNEYNRIMLKPETPGAKELAEKQNCIGDFTLFVNNCMGMWKRYDHVGFIYCTLCNQLKNLGWI